MGGELVYPCEGWRLLPHRADWQPNRSAVSHPWRGPGPARPGPRSAIVRDA